MEIVKFKKDDVVIKQGDDGDEMYVIESGKLTCHKVKDGEEKFLLEYQEG